MTAATETAEQERASANPTMGFWKCWSMSVGVMIGSGIFLLPAVLAPYGSISFLGWLFTSLGAILIALVLARLAGRTVVSGGFYVYTRAAFGDLAGFLVGWSYWLSILFAVAAISVAFAAYAGELIPPLGASNVTQGLVAASMIWLLTGVNVKGVSEAAVVQLTMTLLKIVPLVVIVALGFFVGSAENVPAFNPQAKPPLEALAATALLTMWAFIGIEAGVIPAAEVKNATRTIPRAVITATLVRGRALHCLDRGGDVAIAAGNFGDFRSALRRRGGESSALSAAR